MKVKDLMTPDAKAISITESLAEAAREMWENDCGALPVVKDGRKVVGMITESRHLHGNCDEGPGPLAHLDRRSNER
jgi:CBS-domain-containing membrane protein